MAVRPGNREGKLRSVDSERTGRVIEPRKLCIVEADAVEMAEGSILEPRGGETATLGRIEALAESESRQRTATPLDKVVLTVRARGFHRGLRAGHERKGPPRNLGDLAVSVDRARERKSGGTSKQRDERSEEGQAAGSRSTPLYL